MLAGDALSLPPSRSRSPLAPSSVVQHALSNSAALTRVSTRKPSCPVHSHSVTISNTWSGPGRFSQAACPESGFFRVVPSK